MTTIKQSNRGIKFITSSQRRYYVTLTLPQCCKEPQMWTIGGSAVKFLFRCLKVVKNIINDRKCVCYVELIL